MSHHPHTNQHQYLSARAKQIYILHTHTHTYTYKHTYIHTYTHTCEFLPAAPARSSPCRRLRSPLPRRVGANCRGVCERVRVDSWLHVCAHGCVHACMQASKACVRAASVVEPAQTQAKREQRVGTLARIPAVAPSWGVCLLLASIVLRLTSPPIAHRGRGRQQGYVLEARSVRLLCLGRSIVRCARIFLVSLHASRRQPPSWHRTPSSVPRRPRDTRLFRGTFPARPSKVHTSECWSASHVLTMCVLSVRACACRNRRRAASRSPLAASGPLQGLKITTVAFPKP